MKKILILCAFIFAVYTANAQRKVEDRPMDETQKQWYQIHTEGCEKQKVRFGKKDGTTCPVFIDEEGWLFYIDVIEYYPIVVQLDKFEKID